MALINKEDIIAYHVDGSVLCCDCISDEVKEKAEQDQRNVITTND